MKKVEKRVTVGMPQTLYDALKREAEEERRSVPGYIRWVLYKKLEQK